MKNIESHLENNKYYVPEISEFHVGFEYEFLKNHGSPDEIWEPRKLKTISDGEDDPYLGYTFKSLESYDNVFIRNAWRVKYLNREDIESLGWENEFNEMFGENKYKLNNYIITSIFKNNQTVDISLLPLFKGQGLTRIFRGTIKNKSELKKLMKQLGIND